MANRFHRRGQPGTGGRSHGRGVPDYGLVKGTPARQEAFKTRNPEDDPHLHILVNSGDEPFDVTVDVFSKEGSEVLFLIKTDFVPARASELIALPPGSEEIEPGQPDGLGLDYVRQHLASPDELSLLPIDPVHLDNDLHNALSDLIGRAIEAEADLYAFGSLYDDGSDAQGPNPFNLDPLQGIHNIHMNQGNPPDDHGNENGTFQDGALFVRFAGDPDSWVAVFLAFQSQSFETDDSGDPA